MGITQPWNVVFLIGFALYVGIRGRYARRTRGNRYVVRRVDRWEKLLLPTVIVTSVPLPLLYLFTPILGFADYRIPFWIPWCGLAMMIPALWLFRRSHRDLGRNWSVTLEMREGHRLVTDGVYRSVRHPMYAAIGLWDLSQALMLANWLAGWSALVAFAALYLVRVPREEAMMAHHFGDEYAAYRARTGRLVPRPTSAKHEPTVHSDR